MTGQLKVEAIKALFTEKNATIGIVGLGYVGLPLALRFAEQGYSVIGFDIDQDKVSSIESGKSYISHIAGERVSSAVSLTATTDFSRVSDVDALVICVPTPLGKHHDPDLSYVTSTLDVVLPHLRAGQVVSLESTTYPGTTEEEVVTRVESSGFRPGEDIFVVYSPEREDPGNPDFETHSIPKVIGGHTANCLAAGIALYEGIIDQLVPVSSTRTAEMTKLLENIHRAVNIGLVNEMKTVADRMGIDIFEVIDAAASKPFGFTPYYPGPGLGGHCIPIDPFYLTWKAREYGLNTRFIELAGEVNRAMPGYVANKLIDALNERGRSVKGARILVFGIAYKKNVGDMRESPSVELMELLRDKGADLSYTDPYVPIFPKMREHRFDLASEAITAEGVASYDAVIIGTDHDSFDYGMIAQNAALIIDSRGRYRVKQENIVKA